MLNASGSSCSVIFTNENGFLTHERNKVGCIGIACFYRRFADVFIQVQYSGSTEQDVLYINERAVMVRSKAMYEKPNATTEGIYTDLQNRPSTAVART